LAANDARAFYRADPSGEGVTVTLILGGARSGKSRIAEGLCVGPRTYIATAQAFDDEMRERIAAHKVQRGAGWTTIEAPMELVAALEQARGIVLVDCLTLWLSNLLLAEKDCLAFVDQLLAALRKSKSNIVLVSNEVGLSIVPENRLGRAFRDIQGIANQRIAAVADNVVFVAAGLPLVLKGQLPK
jgi:adenosylcobinamide kinase / adenosylcobinamide-phosphate guanylyltransferase